MRLVIDRLSRVTAIAAVVLAVASCTTAPPRDGSISSNDMVSTRPIVETPQQIEQIVGKRGCGTMIGYRERLRTDIEFRRRRELIERQTRDYIADNADSGSRSGILIIPVVVHVVHNPAVPAQNISDALINQRPTSSATTFGTTTTSSGRTSRW